MKRMNWGRVRRIAAWGALGLSVAAVMSIGAIYAILSLHPLDPKTAAPPEWLRLPSDAGTDTGSATREEPVNSPVAGSGEFQDGRAKEARRLYLELRDEFGHGGVFASWSEHREKYDYLGDSAPGRWDWSDAHQDFIAKLARMIDAGGPVLSDAESPADPSAGFGRDDLRALLWFAGILIEEGRRALGVNDSDRAAASFRRALLLDSRVAGVKSSTSIILLEHHAIHLNYALGEDRNPARFTQAQARSMLQAFPDPKIVKKALEEAWRRDYAGERERLARMIAISPWAIMPTSVAMAQDESDFLDKGSVHRGILKRSLDLLRQSAQNARDFAKLKIDGPDCLPILDTEMQRALETLERDPAAAASLPRVPVALADMSEMTAIASIRNFGAGRFMTYESLSNIMRSALAEVAGEPDADKILDTFSGRPLQRRRDGDSIVVWSVGKNRIDDRATSDSDDISLRLAVAPAASH